ncbi:pimeloyl-ACP methyl ester carboxylesterase [Murinocardiopsis flavida]|uniref:Pimeloyl-ACP methyl ester carboxylesterase n=2 Tax=Murinocardiopsis flavida TaxID=645275 RepID=A0A2P8D3G3_9ACTN|nr:pimeloyl-ACP methyl ester carboxylesterase [Murinocardiopsis flavida]
MPLPGLHTATSAIEGRRIAFDTGGSGPPVLLLHGFPQTRVTWREVAPRLIRRFEVVCPDLPGYGDSDRLANGPEGFAKTRVAEHMVGLMRSLGHDRFAVVGHDRGALVAFRAALDHPEIVSHLGVLDVLPTVDNWAALHGANGVFAFHLYLLAQPSDLPERMIGADPDAFFGHFLDTWTKQAGAIPPEVRAHYLSAMRRPEVIRAVCDDYRASAFIDSAHDEADQRAGHRLKMPVLAAWQDPGDTPLPFDPAQIWSTWAHDLLTLVEPCGHFLPEERPHQITDAITELVIR